MTDPQDSLARPPGRGLASRILWFASVSILASSAVVSGVAIHSVYAQVSHSIERSYPAALARAAEPVRGLLAAGQAELEALAENRDLTRRRGPALAELLLRAAGGSSHFAGLAVLAPDGSLRHTVRSARGVAPEVVENFAGPETKRPAALPATGLRAAGPVISVPLGGADGSLGSLIGTFRPSAFQALLIATQPDEISTVYLIDGQGRVIVGPGASAESGLGHVPAAVFSGGDTAGLHRYVNAHGSHVIGSATPLGFFGWYLVIETPFAAAFAPVLSVVTRIVVADLLLILVLGALTYRFLTATVNPLQVLSDGARRIARGELDLEIPEPDRQDEVGILARTFNDMVCQLRRKQSEIQATHQTLRDRNAELEQANEVLSQLSITDGLTKAHNHRFFQDHLTRELKRAARVQEPVSLLLIDVDNFKQLNDRLGHAAGDELLAGMARTLLNTVRDTDLLARYGGDEFVVLCSNTDSDGAYMLGEKIRSSIEKSSFIVDESMRPTRITVSIGAAQFMGDRRKFFEATDRALYRAKAQGRNCVGQDDGEIVL
jgi:diguanylate cyclase (GGDEF)-like protein